MSSDKSVCFIGALGAEHIREQRRFERQRSIMSKINLGDRVRDKLTEAEGRVIGLVTWWSGCDQAIVQPKGVHDGKPIGTIWQDIHRLEVVETASGDYLPPANTADDPGGLQPVPSSGGKEGSR